MAKLRLNQYLRNELRRNIEVAAHPIDLKVALDKAYLVAVDAVRAAVARTLPDTDRKVLAKYDLLQKRDNIVLILSDGDRKSFILRKEPQSEGDDTVPEDKLFQVPGSWYHEAHTPLNTTETKKVEAYWDAKSAYEAEMKKRSIAFETLISGAVYLEEVVAVWPEAAHLVPETKGLVLALSPEQMAIINAARDEHKD